MKFVVDKEAKEVLIGLLDLAYRAQGMQVRETVEKVLGSIEEGSEK